MYPGHPKYDTCEAVTVPEDVTLRLSVWIVKLVALDVDRNRSTSTQNNLSVLRIVCIASNTHHILFLTFVFVMILDSFRASLWKLL